MAAYEFWFSDSFGLIRRARSDDPEVWRNGFWRIAVPRVLDEIVGHGEDVWSIGNWADSWDQETAAAYAAAKGIDLFAEAFDESKPSVPVEKRPYPEKKVRELTELEKHQIREQIKSGSADTQRLAREFGCSTSQVAGIKAGLHK